MRPTRGTWIAIASIALVIGLLLVAGRQLLSPANGVTDGGRDAVADDTGSNASLLVDIFRRQSPAEIPAFSTGLENLPRSLEGTDVDGELVADAAGHLVLANGVRRVFDWFLSALGEEPYDTVIARIHAYIAHTLPPSAAAEARKLLADYLAYKQGLASLAPTTPPTPGQLDLDAVRAAMDAAHAIRAQHLSPAAIDAFFADDDAYDRYSLDAQAILQDRALGAQQQATKLAALEDTLPPALQASLRAVNQYNNLQSLTADWEQRKGSPAELRQIRENLLGAAAADRLESLDRERAEWDSRMQSWLAERSAVLGDRGLAGPDRAVQVDRLRAQRFSDAELVRVEALERIHDSEGSVPL